MTRERQGNMKWTVMFWKPQTISHFKTLSMHGFMRKAAGYRYRAYEVPSAKKKMWLDLRIQKSG